MATDQIKRDDPRLCLCAMCRRHGDRLCVKCSKGWCTCNCLDDAPERHSKINVHSDAVDIQCCHCWANIRIPAGWTLETNLCVNCGGMPPRPNVSIIPEPYATELGKMAADAQVQLDPDAFIRKQLNKNLRGVFT